MADRLTPESRSRNMSCIRGKDTRPELVVRRLLHRLGYRFRLHDRMLPGSPDIVFRSRRKVIFVHGCFWHRHACCKYASTPRSRIDFWTAKFTANVNRDRLTEAALTALGWGGLVVWECEVGNVEELAERLRAFLDAPSDPVMPRQS